MSRSRESSMFKLSDVLPPDSDEVILYKSIVFVEIHDICLL